MSAERYLRFPKVRKPKGGRSLLWPVNVVKVLYPARRREGPNVFEEAVLGLARARCSDVEDMARHLCLDQDLVAHVFVQLQGQDCLDIRGSLTAKGEELLHGLEDGSSDLKVGYAFQEAITGDWIPRFEDDLPEIEPTGMDGRYPFFVRSRETGEREKPFLIRHNPVPEADLEALLRACSVYEADRFHASQRDDGYDLPPRLRLRGLSVLDDEPQPMWVWTWVFKGPAGAQPWLVTDPFGLQSAAAWLRKPLEAMLPSNDALARYVATTVGKPQSEAQSAAEWLASVEAAADLEVLGQYSWTGKVPHVQDRLTATLRKRTLIEGRKNPLPEDVRSLLVEAQSLVESVLQWLLQAYPMDLRLLRRNDTWTPEEAKKILLGLGLGCLDEHTAWRLRTQSLRDVRWAAESGKSSLKALLTAALLSTAWHVRHPLEALSEEQAGLGRLLDVADARNRKAGHAGTQAASREEALEHADIALRWVKTFKDWY